MNALELLEKINAGETSRVQFKREISSPDALAAEMTAMANSSGGIILVGVQDGTGEIVGLDYGEIQHTGSLAANIATNNLIPLVYIETEVIALETENQKKHVLVIYVKEGVNKPYKDKNLTVWIKQGADKRRVTENFEMLRLFQSSGALFADEMTVPDTDIKDVNVDYFHAYFNKTFEESFEESGLNFKKVLINMNIIRNDKLTLGGLLFFGKDPQQYKPAFCIKAVSFFGNSIGSTEYRDSEDMRGTIPELFEKAVAFLLRNLKKTQQGQNFNMPGKLEVSKIALEEILQNALIHREYFKNAAIRVLLFDNRIEIISPGNLPNSLTVENIKFGNSVIRNNLLASYCVNAMPYRGLGSGIRRAVKEQPNIEFTNDVDGLQFIVTIPRPEEKR